MIESKRPDGDCSRHEQKGQILIDVNWDLLDESEEVPKSLLLIKGDGMSLMN